MLSIYSITTHYSTSMECTLHVLYYTTYLLPSLLPYHPAYLYTRARVKQNGWMDGWMDGWYDMMWYDMIRYAIHLLHHYYYTTILLLHTYYTTTLLHYYIPTT